jgi:hypothetical protein
MSAIRRPGAASAAVLFGLSTSLFAAHMIAPDWSRRTGLDLWNLPSLNAEFRAAADEQDKVSADAERSARRREAANQIAANLATGATTLAVATDEVVEVFQDEPGVKMVLASAHQVCPTDRDRFARHLIERVKRVLAADPDRRAAVVARLEDEFRALSASPAAPTGRDAR